MESIIRDIHLAESGQAKINWVKGHMPLLHYFNEKYAPLQLFKGINMIVTIHLEAKTAYLALTLKNCGANVVVTGSNPLSTQDDVAAALVANGITVFATHGCTNEEYDLYLDKACLLYTSYMADDAFFTANLGINYKITPQAMVSFSVDNLFDRDYWQWYKALGRVYTIGVQFEF